MSIYDNLANDGDYLSINKRYNDLEAKVKKMGAGVQNVDPRVMQYFTKREAQQLENDYLEHIDTKIKRIQEDKRELRLKHERPVYDDATQEVLRRQDFEAKLNNMSQQDLKELVRDTRAEDINIYDFNLIKSKLKDTQGIEATIGNLQQALSIDANPEYQKLDDTEAAYYQLHNGFNGSPYRKELFRFVDGGVEYTNIKDGLNKSVSEYKTPKEKVNINHTLQIMQQNDITDEQLNQGMI